MLYKPSRGQRFVVTALILLEVFTSGAPIVYAQASGLSSLITSGIGSATSAAISCNKGAISKGIASLFGAGSSGGSPTPSTGSNPMANPTTLTNDGTYDNAWGGGANPALTGTTTPTYPSANAGQNSGTNLFAGYGGGSATSQADDTGSGYPTGYPTGTTASSSPTATGPVPVSDANNVKNTTKIAAQTAATNTKLTCTNAIEKAASQTILKQLTLTTINWINHGFSGGSSFFPKDTQSFLKSIGDQEIKQFTDTFGYDSKNYPFGRAVMQGITSQVSNTFANSAKYSLDQVIAEKSPGMTTENFTADFVNGGWAAFNAQFSLGNNPAGFTLGVQNQLTQKTANTAYSPAQDIKDQLARNGGLLDTKICVSPKTYDAGGPGTSDPIAAQARIDLNNALASQQTGGSNALLSSLITQQQQKIAANTCVQYQTQTPGSAVSSALNTALNSPFKQLEMGQDLSTDLTAVFDALTNQLVQKGLSSLTTSANQTSSGSQQTYTNNSSYVPNVSVDGSDASGTNFLSAGDAYQTNIFDLDPSGKEALPASSVTNLSALAGAGINASQLNSEQQYALNTAVNGVTFSNSAINTTGTTNTGGTTGTDTTTDTTDSTDDSSAPVQRTNLVGLIDREQQLVPTTDSTANALASNLGWTPAQKAVWVAAMQARDPNYTNLLGKQVNLAERLLPAIYQLDFCVPGPHPGWQADADASFQAFLADKTRFPTDDSMSGLAAAGSKYGVLVFTAIGATIGSVVPGIGTAIGAIVGTLVGVVVQIISNSNLSDDKKNESAFKGYLDAMLNVSVGDYHNEWHNGPTNTANSLTGLEQEYLGAMNAEYSPSVLEADPYDFSPQIISDDTTEWNNIPTYAQSISDNATAISDTQSIIGQLVFLGKRIHDLETNANNLDGYPNPAPKTYQDFQDELTVINGVTDTSTLTGYQRELKRINDTFNLIAPDLLADSDIATQEAALDNLSTKLDNIAGPEVGSDINECIQEVNYIQNGCQVGGTATCPGAKNADGAPMEPVGRIPFPAAFAPYFTQSFINQFHYTISFLPDFYYGSSDGGSGGLGEGNLANTTSAIKPPTGNKFTNDPNVASGSTLETALDAANTNHQMYIADPSQLTIPDPNLVEGNIISTPTSPQGDITKRIDQGGAFSLDNQMYPYSLAGLEAMIGIY